EGFHFCGNISLKQQVFIGLLRPNEEIVHAGGVSMVAADNDPKRILLRITLPLQFLSPPTPRANSLTLDRCRTVYTDFNNHRPASSSCSNGGIVCQINTNRGWSRGHDTRTRTTAEEV